MNLDRIGPPIVLEPLNGSRRVNAKPKRKHPPKSATRKRVTTTSDGMTVRQRIRQRESAQREGAR